MPETLEYLLQKVNQYVKARPGWLTRVPDLLHGLEAVARIADAHALAPLSPVWEEVLRVKAKRSLLLVVAEKRRVLRKSLRKLLEKLLPPGEYVCIDGTAASHIMQEVARVKSEAERCLRSGRLRDLVDVRTRVQSVLEESLHLVHQGCLRPAAAVFEETSNLLSQAKSVLLPLPLSRPGRKATMAAVDEALGRLASLTGVGVERVIRLSSELSTARALAAEAWRVKEVHDLLVLALHYQNELRPMLHKLGQLGYQLALPDARQRCEGLMGLGPLASVESIREVVRDCPRIVDEVARAVQEAEAQRSAERAGQGFPGHRREMCAYPRFNVQDLGVAQQELEKRILAGPSNANPIFFDYSRLEVLLSVFRPQVVLLGAASSAFKDYIGFEVGGAVVIDCPVYGNAVYVFREQMFRLAASGTKRDARDWGAERVFHSTGDWVERVKVKVRSVQGLW